MSKISWIVKHCFNACTAPKVICHPVIRSAEALSKVVRRDFYALAVEGFRNMLRADTLHPHFKHSLYDSGGRWVGYGQSLMFEINESSALEWRGAIDITADQFLEDGGTSISKLETAKNFLMDILADGEKSQKEILGAAAEMDFSKRTLDEAKKALAVTSFKVGESWYWKLSE